MKIVFLDAKTIGDDIDLSGYEALGEVIKYGFSTAEEAAERAKDADVLVINKVEINEKSIGEADHLKLVCVTATGGEPLVRKNVPVLVEMLKRSIHTPVLFQEPFRHWFQYPATRFPHSHVLS